MRALIGVAVLLCASFAFAGTEYIDRCTSDFSVHVVVDGKPMTQAVITGEHVTGLKTSTDARSGRATLNVEIGKAGADRLHKHTEENLGEQLAVFCEDEEIWRATINSPFAKRFSILLPN